MGMSEKLRIRRYSISEFDMNVPNALGAALCIMGRVAPSIAIFQFIPTDNLCFHSFIFYHYGLLIMVSCLGKKLDVISLLGSLHSFKYLRRGITYTPYY